LNGELPPREHVGRCFRLEDSSIDVSWFELISALRGGAAGGEGLVEVIPILVTTFREASGDDPSDPVRVGPDTRAPLRAADLSEPQIARAVDQTSGVVVGRLGTQDFARLLEDGMGKLREGPE